MALYAFICDNDDCPVESREEFMSYDDYHLPVCEECGREMRRDYRNNSFSFQIDFRAGFDVGLGEYCNTARERDTYVDIHNLGKKY